MKKKLKKEKNFLNLLIKYRGRGILGGIFRRMFREDSLGGILGGISRRMFREVSLEGFWGVFPKECSAKFLWGDFGGY